MCSYYATRRQIILTLLAKAKTFVEWLTGLRIYRRLPRGLDFVWDIKCAFPMYRVNIVFDVGANVGQFAKLFLAEFPNSHVYCFEPVSKTYGLLLQNLRRERRVVCHRLALGSSKKIGQMVLQGGCDEFFLLGQSPELPKREARMEPVTIDTLDDFCQAKGIEHISYLKIDTEGGDLDVLKGAARLLAEQRIDIIQVEAGMNPTDRRHVPFETLKEFLLSHKYYLFGLYEQVAEAVPRQALLRRTNPIFVSENMIEAER